MSLYNGPVRAGARGGADQFSWDAVKSDKDREFYLGHSVKALAGRWQKGKDVYWYTREKEGDGNALQDEIKAVKAREEEAMLEALGLKPKTVKPLAPAALDQAEMAKLLKRGRNDDEHAPVQGAMGVPGVDGDKTSGLGFSVKAADGTVTGPGDQGMEMGGTMAGVGIPSGDAGAGRGGGSGARFSLPGPPVLPGPPPLNTSAAMLAMVRSGVKLTSEQKKMLSGADRKVAKKARREAKKAKKTAKKATKEKKKHKRSKSSSGSSEDGSSSSDDEMADPAKGTGAPGAGHRDHDRAAGRHGSDSNRARHEEERLPQRRRHDSPEPVRGHADLRRAAARDTSHPSGREDPRAASPPRTGGRDDRRAASPPRHRQRSDSPPRADGRARESAEAGEARGRGRAHDPSPPGRGERIGRDERQRRRSPSRSRSREDRGRGQRRGSRSQSPRVKHRAPANPSPPRRHRHSRSPQNAAASPRRRARHDSP